MENRPRRKEDELVSQRRYPRGHHPVLDNSVSEWEANPITLRELITEWASKFSDSECYVERICAHIDDLIMDCEFYAADEALAKVSKEPKGQD